MNVKSKGVLKPSNRPISKYRIAAFDIETYGDENTFYMGSIIYRDITNNYKKGIKKFVFYDKIEFIEHLLTHTYYERRCLIFATNLQFDILGIFEDTKYIGLLKPMIRGSKFINVNILKTDKQGKGRKLKFYDTLNFCTMSVEEMGEFLGLPKLEKPSFIGNKPKDAAEKKILEEYNLMDSLITLHFAEYLQESFNKLGCNLRSTVAATAMDLFKRKYLKESIKQPEIKIIDYIQEGYYGGRTEAFKRGKIKDLYLYDINSLYPSVMCFYKYPNPNHCYFKEGDVSYHIENYEGIAEVLIKSPKMNIPYLPHRVNGKLLFPEGVFKGKYTHFELRRALELGYKILKTYSCVYYTKTHKIFNDYVTELYEERMKHKGDDFELTIKICLNSLYGKFAESRFKDDSIVHISHYSQEEFLKLWNSDKKLKIVNDFIYMEENNGYFGSHINPIYSAYVTAYARDYLYRSFPEDVYYCDTDSIMTENPIETGSGLGEWKEEMLINEGVIIRPKAYLINNKVKFKGCSRMKPEEFKLVLSGEPYEFERFIKFKEAIRRKLSFNEKIMAVKDLDLEDSKRVWNEPFNPDKLQTSKPIEIYTVEQ